VLFTPSLFSLELWKNRKHNNFRAAIEVVLGKDKRGKKIKLMRVYDWETKNKEDQNPSEFIYFADFA